MPSPSYMFDPYNRKARLQPALLVALPIAIAVLAVFPNGLTGWKILWSVLVGSGCTVLVAQFARDRGRQKEPELFQAWGGKPTTKLLRYRGTTNVTLLERWHRLLQLQCPELAIPTRESEAANPAQADQVYEACTSTLIQNTRDKKRFPLVFEENCNYGFRRNLWGMKPLGIAGAAASTLVLWGSIVTLTAQGMTVDMLMVVGALFNTLVLIAWLVLITPSWISLAADAYALQLVRSCENL